MSLQTIRHHPHVLEKQLKTFSQMNNNQMTTKKLQSLSKNDLIEKCKELNINCYGTKFDMTQRILASQKKGIITEIKHSIPPIIVEIDEDTGKFIHRPTRLIFDPEEKRVVARKDMKGNVQPLQYSDVKLCMKYKFRYLIPENLACDDNSTSQNENMGSKSSNDIEKQHDLILQKRLQEINEQTSTNHHVDDDDDNNDDNDDDDEDIDDKDS